MEIELVTIGDEVIAGAIVNTNTVFISQELNKRGYQVIRQTTLPDHWERMKQGLQEALERATVVITTGGLGPTVDDLTRGVAAELFQSDVRFDEAIARDLKARFGKAEISLEDQATVPVKAEVFPNKVGSAPALVFDKRLILLPGVPNEMRAFFKDDILPYLEKHYPPQEPLLMRELHFCLLTETLLDQQLRRLSPLYTDVQMGIYPATGVCTVRLKGLNPKSLEGFAKGLVEAFPTHQLPAAKAELAIHELLCTRGLTLACGESCTGGMIAEKLTAIPGASHYFLGSLVTYANSCKEKWLGVSAQTLEEKGAVSREVVSEMWQGVLNATSADYALAVSGIAGPTGGTPEKPVGTVWAAIGRRGEAPDVWTFRVQLNREGIIMLTTQFVLSALYRKIVYGVAGGS